MERLNNLEQFGVTKFTSNAYSPQKERDSELHFNLWDNAVVDEAVNPLTGATATIFNLDGLGMTNNQAYEIVAFHKPKNGSKTNADGLFVHKMTNNRGIFFWVGDGLNFIDEPTPELREILIDNSCLQRPDAFPRVYLQKPESNLAWSNYNWKNPESSDSVVLEFMKAYERKLGDYYKSKGVDVDNISSSQLPSTCGTAVFLPNYGSIQIASIGDLPNKIKVGGVYQDPLARQNLGIDNLTVAKINEFLESGVETTVTEVRHSKEFKDWIRFTFNEKINKSVTVINGNGGFFGGYVASCVYPTEWVSTIVVATDGFVLGQEEPATAYMRLESCKSANDVVSLIDEIAVSQGQTYREDFCVQEKESDDIGGILVRQRNQFDRSDLGRLLR